MAVGTIELPKCIQGKRNHLKCIWARPVLPFMLSSPRLQRNGFAESSIHIVVAHCCLCIPFKSVHCCTCFWNLDKANQLVQPLALALKRSTLSRPLLIVWLLTAQLGPYHHLAFCFFEDNCFKIVIEQTSIKTSLQRSGNHRFASFRFV